MFWEDYIQRKMENKVLGFQFEPKRNKTSSKTTRGKIMTMTVFWGEDEKFTGKFWMGLEIDSWCKCENCEKMDTEREHFCCFQLDAAKYFGLGTGEDGESKLMYLYIYILDMLFIIGVCGFSSG